MSYLKFDKDKLINLEYSLNKEVLNSNRAGSYASSTIIWSNTRKYHGLLVCPIAKYDDERFLLLSSLDETIIQHHKEFNLAVHKYPGNVYDPHGHKYISDFEAEPIPHITYRVGGVVLTKEILLVQHKEQILIKYTLVDAHSPTKIRLKPFLAFRNIHALSKANLSINPKYAEVTNGIKTTPYGGMPSLFMQCSKKADFIPVPHWHYNIEYIEELKRGYDGHEDLFVPGYFEYTIKKGESIIFSASLEETTTVDLKTLFQSEIEKRVPRNNFKNCLVNSAQQFVVRRDKKTSIIAGYPWFGVWGRDTFISLPGLTLAIDDVQTCKDVLDTMSAQMKDGLFGNMGTEHHMSFNSIDAPFWYIWALQQYTEYTKNYEEVWKTYGPKVKQILKSLLAGTNYNIKIQDESGLVYGGQEGHALTWMDAIVYGKPVTPRIGYNVEINALWYNDINFLLSLAEKAGEKAFIKEWKEWPAKIKGSFISTFWDDTKKYLADYVNHSVADWAVRPNQVFATSLAYSPLDDDQKKAVLDIIEKELVTPKGLRTLSPKHPDYIGVYSGSQPERDSAYHQGTVWPWLISHYAEGTLRLYGKSAISKVKKLVANFEPDMHEHGISSISEVYDGNPPHLPGGTISQAWSVSEVLRMIKLIDEYNK